MPCLTREERSVPKCVCEEGGPLDAGKERDCEIACVSLPELTELFLGPVDDLGHDLCRFAVEASFDLVELCAESPHWTAVVDDGVAHVVPVPHERLQSRLRG